VNAAWQTKSLGDLCSIDKQQGVYEWLPYVGMEDIESETGRFLGSTKPRSVKSSTFRFTERHILYGRLRPYLNKVLLPDFEGHCSTEIFPLLPNDNTSKAFLRYWLIMEANVVKINETCTGARMPRANVDELLGFELQIPGLKEQERIVAILDEAFEAIATAKANAQRSLEDSRDLFDRSFMSLVSKRGPRWADLALGEICEIERGSSPRPIKNFFTTQDDGVNWIKIGDATDGEKYIYSTKQKITPEGAKQSRFVKEGDFLLTNSMSFGKSYVMKTTGYIHDGWFVLRLKKSINQDYLYYLLSSRLVRSQFNALASGAIVLNINSDLVKRAVLPIPPLDEQKRLVDQTNVMLEETDRLKVVYQKKLNALASLKQSLLHQAFTSKL